MRFFLTRSLPAFEGEMISAIAAEPPLLETLELYAAKSGDELPVPASETGSTAAFIWKTVADPFAGRITMFRVVSGALKADSTVQNLTKGVPERLVIFKHALRNAFIPVITVIGIQIGNLIGGSVIIEQIFGLPGVGWFLLQGIFGRDYPVVQVTALFLATVFVVVNLLVDLTYAYLDPRIKYT